VDVDACFRTARGPHANAWLRRDARGRDGRLCQELAAGVEGKRSPQTDEHIHPEDSRDPA
jgi:hypothetical protein